MMSEYTIDPEYIALLRRVCEKPADNAPRGVIADWIQDHGDDERAEFIRLQCNGMECGPGDRNSIPSFAVAKSYFANCPNFPQGSFVKWSRGFISEIRLTCAEFIGGPCGKCNGTGWITSRVWHGPTQDDDEISTSSSPCEHCKRTGHIDGIARELFQKHPIVKVVLTDKRPQATNNEYYWNEWRGTVLANSDLPGELCDQFFGPFNHREIFQSETAAHDALSDACVAYGRKLVGLPDLDFASQENCSNQSK